MRITILLTFVSTILALAVTSAQVTTATFYAIVTDPSDAVVANASITLREERTGIINEKVTDPTGECAFTFVPIGIYTITIKAPGFKELTVSELTLDAGQNFRRKFALQVGGVGERVQVTAEAPLVNAVSAEQQETIKSSQIAELPVARRRASDLFAIGTAITRAQASNNSNVAGSYVMNGLGSGSLSLTMDGIPASGHPATPQAGLRGGFNYIEVISLEAIGEISVAKGAFAAEFAHALSGNINVITKSGTNQWHGSLFEAFNAEELNARHTLLPTKPAATFNQFGGSLGGPIVKDRIFIFGTYEGYRDRSSSVYNSQVPTQRLRNDMIARVPDYKLLLDQIYLPNQPHDPTGLTGSYIGPGSIQASTNQLIIKSDAYLSSNSKVSATWLRDRPDSAQPIPFGSPGPKSTRRFSGEVDRLNLTFTTSRANWSSETRFGRNRVDNSRLDDYYALKDPKKEESTPGGRRLPALFAFGLGFGLWGENNFVGNLANWIIEQKMTLQRGHHSLKFGGLLNRGGTGAILAAAPTLFYIDEQDLFKNAPIGGLLDFGLKPWVGRTHNVGLFVQDDWKVSPKLVLNLGLRYDFFGHMVVKGQDGSPSPALYLAPFVDFRSFTQGKFRPTDNAYDNAAVNFGPRFGFAYNPDGAGKTVIRGGFGVMFIPPNLSVFEFSSLNTFDLPFRVQPSKAEFEKLKIGFPSYLEDLIPIFKAPGFGGTSVQQVDTKLRAPYAMNYALGIQRALTSTLMVESAFVGNRGLRFTGQRIYNEADRLTGLRPNPNLGQARLWDNTDSTFYTSWQSSLRQRLNHSLTGTVHYTWGKALSYYDGDLSFDVNNSLQEFLDVRSNRGRSKEDIKHRFVSSFVYNVPFFSNSGPLLRTALGGWEASGIFQAQTGYPITVTQSSAKSGSRPDVIGFKGAILDRGLQWINPAAFALVPVSPVSGATVRPGTAGRSAFSGPGRWNLDFSLSKNFRIREASQIQFRADMLNALNHADFVDVVTEIGRSDFGRLVGATNPRVIQFHLRFSF